MNRVIFRVLLLYLAFCGSQAFSHETAVVIKVRGMYGIIDKGANQGLKQGQELFVKRVSDEGLRDIGKVKVIRVTANRAAVAQLGKGQQPLLHKGDRLFSIKQIDDDLIQEEGMRSGSAVSVPTQPSVKRSNSLASFAEPVHSEKEIPVPEEAKPNYARSYQLKKPWIALNLGAIFPSGELATSYVPSLKLGGSYMLSAGKDLNLGVEINKTFFSNATFASASTRSGSTVSSSSVLEAFVVFQKFFGSNLFVETGGGIYRPQIRTISIDNIESSFSSSHFGLFGGAGFFVPTSQYAGITFKGRLHNYFDHTAKQYFGLTGGVRFKIR